MGIGGLIGSTRASCAGARGLSTRSAGNGNRHHRRNTSECAARTLENDILSIVEFHSDGIAIERRIFCFKSDPAVCEDWTWITWRRPRCRQVCDKPNLPSMYVTEDTVRTDRDTVKRLFTAIRSGAGHRYATRGTAHRRVHTTRSNS